MHDDAYIGGRSENNIKCVVHDDLGWSLTHWSLYAPFHASVLRPASQVGPMHKAAWMGKLVNAALLSLIRRV